MLIENETENGIFKCMESMARDMRHPYIPSTTVLGDIYVNILHLASANVMLVVVEICIAH